MSISRREFVSGAVAAAAVFVAPVVVRGMSSSCPFRVSVINDEISQDFDHACSVAAKDFGLEWMELRGMWNKNITALDANELAQAKRTLAKYNLKVTDIASPLFKVDWPSAPLSKQSERRDTDRKSVV